MEVEYIDIEWQHRSLRIEYQWLGKDDRPLIVFLHEGLGSLAMWKDFPATLCEALGYRGLVFSRPGYGASTPRSRDEDWGVDFMHLQACELLPALFEALRVDTLNNPPWLFGHSDGASIALIYAAHRATRLAGLVVVSPHILVEDLSISSIEKTRRAYLESNLKDRLAPYHEDVDSAFWGWNNDWLSPLFRDWTIAQELRAIACPLLALQGIDDEYGTLEQVCGIRREVGHCEVAVLGDCGHTAHRDQPGEVIRLTSDFMHRQRQQAVARQQVHA